MLIFSCIFNCVGVCPVKCNYANCSNGSNAAPTNCSNGSNAAPTNCSNSIVEDCAQKMATTVLGHAPGQCPGGDCNGVDIGSFHECPAWFIGNHTKCTCGQSAGGIVHCNQSRLEIMLLVCNCMTHDEKQAKTFVGPCSYSCYHQGSLTMSSYSGYRHFYNVLKKEIGKEICGPLNRQGMLCGQCKEGYVPPVYSYDLRCVKCSSGNNNWVKYTIAAFLPLTVFYFFIVAFRVSATAPSMNAFVQVSQAIATPALVRIIMFSLELHTEYTHPITSWMIRSLLAIYGIWNLDFFRTIIPPQSICLPVNTLEAIAIDYIAAIYPLVLICITYIFIELHDHNCRLIVLVWKPFHWCLARFRRQWNMKTSIVDAFATFFLLSYVKLLSISFDLLVPTRLYNINGTRVSTYQYLYYDATIEIFGKKHLYYAIVAIVVLVVFVGLPLLLLLLYPLRCFQRCLGFCRLNRQMLRIFIEVFQGSYKDGTNGTRDCRYFAALYLVIRILLFIFYALTLSGYFYCLAALSLTTLAILVTLAQPHKQTIHNKVDTVLILILAMWFYSLSAVDLAAYQDPKLMTPTLVIVVILILLPLLYVIGLILYWFYKQMSCLHRVAVLSNTLPHRVARPEEYTALLPHFD